MSIVDMEFTEGQAFCHKRWEDHIACCHDEVSPEYLEMHACYLDKGHEGACVCGYCDIRGDD